MTEDAHDHNLDAQRAASSPAERAPGTSPAASSDDWLLVGQIVGAFGVHGELKVRPETDFPERFAATPVLYLGPDHRPIAVMGARTVGPHVLVQLSGIDDATVAARLRGQHVYVPAADAMPLPPDHFYLHDVIGLRVERPNGQMLGTVADVYTGTGQDIFVIREADSGRDVLVPSVKEMVKRVDVQAGVVIVDPIPGLFDERFDTAK
jgi:16S rRNA processing protein RimM